jgi:hypothetical protein
VLRAGVYIVTYVVGGGALVWLGRRFPLTPERWAGVVAGNVLAVIITVVAFTAFRLASFPLTNPGVPVDWWGSTPGVPSFRAVFIDASGGLFMILALFLCVGNGWVYFARGRDAEVRRNRLHAELANARLQAVQFQLQPQLVFAAFHALGGLMRTDVDAAERLLLQVAALMRALLRRVDASMVPLRDEAAALDAFQAVARATATPFTPATLSLPPQAEWALVPPSVLQRLVDVAGLLRGGASTETPVHVSAAWSAAWLELSAATPVPAEAADGAAAEEMERMRAYLEEIYGDELSLGLDRRADAAELRLQVPLLTALPRNRRPEPAPPAREREILATVRSGSASAPGPGTSA